MKIYQKTPEQLEDQKSHENFMKDLLADDSLSDEEKIRKACRRMRNLDDHINSLQYDLYALEDQYS